MRIQMADLQAQYESMREEMDAAVGEVLKSCRFILGPNVSALEEEIAAYSDCKYAVGVASGSDAICLALAACGVGPGDEVITTPFTFVATTEMIVRIGATPVFADIDPRTYILTPETVAAKITSRTKAILPVHLYGQTVDLTGFEKLAQEHGLILVSDGAQAIGAKHNGHGIGHYGQAATLSFFPTKNLGCAGDGGMVLTNDAQVAERVKSLRFHGSGGTYAYDHVGWCSRLDEIQAAILRVKLKRLSAWNAARGEHAEIYTRLLAGCGLQTPAVGQGNLHVWHQYTVRTPHRDALQAFLKEHEVSSAVYYPGALHTQPAYAYLGYHDGDMPEAELAAREVLSLPVYAELANASVEQIAALVCEFQKRSGCC